MSNFQTEVTRNDKYGFNVRYTVEGFWSSSTIAVYQHDHNGVWQEPEISRSTGGLNADFDHLKAEMNFAEALMDAVCFAKVLKKRVGKPCEPLDGHPVCS